MSVGGKGRLKNAIGRPSCFRTAPIAIPLASVSIVKGRSKLGSQRSGVDVRSCFRELKVVLEISVHWKASLQRSGHFSISLDESSIEPGQSEKSMQCFNVSWRGPIYNCLNFGWIN